ncbi:hypothetical protein MOOR_00690 [Moorella thermoacetica]|uniref:Copper amine oxidase-like N-terminal domain-containing protein n=1 Tax=Neomoorella thermoacetica TaxID=1525 RepID=A0A1J5JZP7_NEOTH|nr:copper amine oxidase N-terminal domain-containing protein [Moorella thermoacetica]OIQ09999.1 hypothetical protein MOOR_00690 [Moorella thermoacetica]
MLKTRKKWISILLTLAMLVGLMVPLAAPALANGVSVNVNKVPSLDKDSTDTQALGSIQISEDADYPNDFVNGDTFIITLPSGVKWDKDATTVTGATYSYSGDYTMNLTISGATGSKDIITINPRVKFDGFDGGDIIAVINGMDASIPSGEYLVGRAQGGGTESIALSTKTIGEGSAVEAGMIRITETTQGSLKSSATDVKTASVGGTVYYTQKITLTLPNDFSWNSAKMTEKAGSNYANVTALGAFSNGNVVKVAVRDNDSKKLDVYINLYSPSKASTGRGIIEIRPFIDVDSDADYGNVDVDIEGDDIDDATVTIAQYADFGVSLTAGSTDVEEVVAGSKDVELTKLVIEENVAGSLTANRNIEIKLPAGVKVANKSNAVSKSLKKGSDIFGAISYKDESTIRIPVTGTSTSKAKLEIKFDHMNIAADKTGDIEVEVTGSAGVEGKVVIGKALAPLSFEVPQAASLKLGVKDQAVGNIVLTEAKDGALKDDKDLILSAPDGVTFASTPKVEVLEGNLKIKDEDVKLQKDDKELVIPIDSESSRVSKIKVSGIALNVDRTVPVGPVSLTVKGDAVAETYKDYMPAGEADYGFSTETAGKILVGNVVTPAPTETTRNASFVIGTTTYTVNGVEATMDVAAYTKDGRTYLPVRFVANALGITPENILWDGRTATFIGNGRVVQAAPGSAVLSINGAPITMDVPTELVNGRVMVPFRWVAQAFGAQVNYDEATQTVTMTL